MPADDPAVPGQSRPDCEVGVAGDQRRHQRQQRIEVGGHVDVHVGEDLGIRSQPDRVQRPATTLLLEPYVADLWPTAGQVGRDRRSAVCAGVVCDRDSEPIGEEPAQVPVQPLHGRRQVGLFVVDRDGHVQHRPQPCLLLVCLGGARSGLGQLRHVFSFGSPACVLLWSTCGGSLRLTSA